ncbi:MAG: hypothetical protein ACPL1D_01525 [Microgenomates group bacterium]
MKAFLLIKPNKKELNEFLQRQFPFKDKFIINLKPQKTIFSIEDIRLIKKEVFYQHTLFIIYILENFDKSSLEAQNAFLKLLEEPPEKVYFILTSESQYHLLPTIVSRTKIINFSRYRKESDTFDKIEFIKEINQWVNFSSKEEALDFLDKLIFFLKKKIKDYPNNLNLIYLLKEAIKINHLIKNNNLNFQLAIDHLLIFIKKNSIVI